MLVPSPRRRGGRLAVSLFTPAYAASIAVAICIGTALCLAARHYPGYWTGLASRILAAVLAAETVVWQIDSVVRHTWAIDTNLPLDLCDMTLLVAVVACWTRKPLLVAVLYFWGLAGTLQAVLTPELYSRFPDLPFLEYVVEHLGILMAAVFLVVGLGITPVPGAQ